MVQAWWRERCRQPSVAHATLARERQASLTKPAGSLGRLEELAVELAGLQATERPRAGIAPIVVFAGDHGVTAQGVSAYPSAVTVEMMRNFARGGAAISVLARELGSTLSVVDAGSLACAPAAEEIIVDKPRAGTRDFSREPAMTADEVAFAFGAGQRAVDRCTGADVLLLGEMGIGNTTAAAAMTAALTGRPAREVTGLGTGLDPAALAHKVRVIDAALVLHGLAGRQPGGEDVLAAVGGLEIAALTGAIIAAGQRGVPVLVDGFIVTAAALAAVCINPTCRPWLVFSHRSAEMGHRLLLAELDARPILDLELRLGEGSGAALALPMLRFACALHAGMSTFAEAAVSQRAAP